MSRFIRLSPDPNNTPRRVRIDEFGNGLRAQVEFGSLDIRYWNKTGKDRLNWSEIPALYLGFYTSTEELKAHIQCNPRLKLTR